MRISEGKGGEESLAVTRPERDTNIKFKASRTKLLFSLDNLHRRASTRTRKEADAIAGSMLANGRW